MVAMTDLNTGLGRRCCMTALVNTLDPKISPGASGLGKKATGGIRAAAFRVCFAVVKVSVLKRISVTQAFEPKSAPNT